MRRLLWVNLETSNFDNRGTPKACSFPSYDYLVPELEKCEPLVQVFFLKLRYLLYPHLLAVIQASLHQLAQDLIQAHFLASTFQNYTSQTFWKKIIHVPWGRATALSCWARWIAASLGSPRSSGAAPRLCSTTDSGGARPRAHPGAPALGSALPCSAPPTPGPGSSQSAFLSTWGRE